VTVDGSPHWVVVNIGDSRVYRVVDGSLSQVSRDHSEVAELVTLGLLTPEEALVHPARNIVTRCLGREPLEPVDSWVFPPHAGERFLLCTDGLTNELRDSAIAGILADGADPQAIADRLVAAAVEAGGRDNVTVVVVLGSSAAEDDGSPRRREVESTGDRRDPLSGRRPSFPDVAPSSTRPIPWSRRIAKNRLRSGVFVGGTTASVGCGSDFVREGL
jgi:PPM family protein phosphatase